MLDKSLHHPMSQFPVFKTKKEEKKNTHTPKSNSFCNLFEDTAFFAYN